MGSEEVFATAVIWAKSYGKLLNEVIPAIGFPRILMMSKKSGENRGARFVDGLKKMGGFTPEAMAKLIDQAYLPMGFIDIENKVTPTSLVMTIGKCPLYEGFKMAGLDDETIGKMCETREAGINAKITEAFDVTVNLTMNKPDGQCVTVFKVEK